MWKTFPEMSRAPHYSIRNVFCAEYVGTLRATARPIRRPPLRHRNRLHINPSSESSPSNLWKNVHNHRTNTRFSDYWKPRRNASKNNSLSRFHHSIPNRNIRARQMRQNHLQSLPGRADSKVLPHPFHSKRSSIIVANPQSQSQLQSHGPTTKKIQKKQTQLSVDRERGIYLSPHFFIYYSESFRIIQNPRIIRIIII